MRSQVAGVTAPREMGFTAGVLVFLLIFYQLQRSSLGQTCTELDPSRITFFSPFPGELFGSATAPTYCTDVTTLLSCSTDPLTLNRLTDGEYGDTSNGVNSSQFIAWNDSSRIVLTRSGGTDTLGAVRTVNLYFYHDLALGIGLPEFILSASNSETRLGDTLPYTILSNQDLEASDAQIRTVTLALTQAIMEEANRFHIRFSLMTGVQQFALSEVELCSDIATVEAETLSVMLSSEPVETMDGSTVLILANRTGVDGDSVIRLSCTVVNQGRFTWVWTLPGPVSSAIQQQISDSQQILDATRTTVIEIPRSRDSIGDYTCTAIYHIDTRLPASPAIENLTVDVELVLYPSKTEVSFNDNELVLLECILAGDKSETEKIQWMFDGQILSNSGKYLILESDNIICDYGTCHRSQLQIRQASDNDAGMYTCSYAGHSDVITLMNSYSPSVQTSTPTSSDNLPINTPLIAGLTVAGIILVLGCSIIVTVTCVLMRRWKSQPKEQLDMYDYVGPPTLPPERITQLRENIAYGNRTDLHSVVTQQTDVLQLKENEANGQKDVVQMKENEAYGQKDVVQMKENEAYGQKDVVQMKENEAYGQKDVVQMKENEAYGQKYVVQMKENEAYGQKDVVQMKENEAYGQKDVVQMKENEAYGRRFFG